MSRRLPLALLVFALGHVAASAAEVATRGVVFVANGEGGTVTMIDSGTYQVLRSIDVIPDGDRPSLERDPVQAMAFPAVVFAGGDNFAQDLDISPDGRTLYVSRGHLGDVAAFDVASGAMLWRAEVGSFRADHMTISADGARLFVSAITENHVEVLDAASGAPLGAFAAGEWPHDNVLSADGKRVYNGGIGNVLLPEEARNDRPEALDAVVSPPYQLTIADAATLEIVGTHRFERGICSEPTH
ncbi:MAG: YncE family protein [Candidatus Binatia bacterium]